MCVSISLPATCRLGVEAAAAVSIISTLDIEMKSEARLQAYVPLWTLEVSSTRTVTFFRVWLINVDF